MMPLSYQGFGFTSIVVMVLILTVSQLVRYIREHAHKHNQPNRVPERLPGKK